jgi:hypothetical protein
MLNITQLTVVSSVFLHGKNIQNTNDEKKKEENGKNIPTSG